MPQVVTRINQGQLFLVNALTVILTQDGTPSDDSALKL